MPVPGVTFNHIGICVTDLARSRRFYEQLLGFTFLGQASVPDELIAPMLRIDAPAGCTNAFLRHGGVVVELLHFDRPANPQRRERVMNEPGLTHLSVKVDDFEGVLEKVSEYGGEVLLDTNVGLGAFIRDPDGQLIEIATIGVQEGLDLLAQLQT